MTHKGWSVKPQHNQSIFFLFLLLLSFKDILVVNANIVDPDQMPQFILVHAVLCERYVDMVWLKLLSRWN